MDEEKKQKIEKWIYFIPASIEILWMILYNPVYKFIEWKYEHDSSLHMCFEAQDELNKISLCILVVTLILRIAIGGKLKKANYKIDVETKMLSISIYIIVVITILLKNLH